MVNVAQLVRASDCGPEGRGFKPHLSPRRVAGISGNSFFILACPKIVIARHTIKTLTTHFFP